GCKIKIDLKKLSLKLLYRLRRLFSEKAFSKGQMILFCGIILYGTFIYKDIFQFMSFLVVTLIGWLSGHIGLKHVKAVLEKAERVINNPHIPIDKKYVEAVGAVHTSCDYLGRVMEAYNLKQGTAPYLKDLKEKKGGESKSG
ncbi:hypothetical protein LCGC14_2609280, partial [marine sediment metagenome]